MIEKITSDEKQLYRYKEQKQKYIYDPENIFYTYKEQEVVFLSINLLVTYDI